MRTLLAALGDPQLAYPAIHVVGTNGKSTATRTIEALLLGEGLSTGATVSPHVRSWAERITVDGKEADFETAIGACQARGRGAGGDAVRDGLRSRLRRVRRARDRRRSGRGGSRRPARRDERPPLACRPPDERRPRAHGRARRDARGDRGREARGRPGGDRSQCFRTRSSPTLQGRTSSSAAHARRRRRSSGDPSSVT